MNKDLYTDDTSLNIARAIYHDSPYNPGNMVIGAIITEDSYRALVAGNGEYWEIGPETIDKLDCDTVNSMLIRALRR